MIWSLLGFFAMLGLLAFVVALLIVFAMERHQTYSAKRKVTAQKRSLLDDVGRE